MYAGMSFKTTTREVSAALSAIESVLITTNLSLSAVSVLKEP